MQGESLNACGLGAHGLRGDRGWALRGPGVRPIVGLNLSAKQSADLLLCSARFESEPDGETLPYASITLPNGRHLRTDEAGAAALSKHLGQPVSFHPSSDGGHFDSGTVHVVTTESLGAWDARRFRPNLVIETKSGRPFPEAGWLGREVQVGQAVLRFLKATQRCVMTTHAQPGLPKDPAVMKALVRQAGGALGIYAEVLRPGLVKAGDLVGDQNAPGAPMT